MLIHLLLRRFKPDYTFVCLDSRETSWAGKSPRPACGYRSPLRGCAWCWTSSRTELHTEGLRCPGRDSGEHKHVCHCMNWHRGVEMLHEASPAWAPPCSPSCGRAAERWWCCPPWPPALRSESRTGSPDRKEHVRFKTVLGKNDAGKSLFLVLNANGFWKSVTANVCAAVKAGYHPIVVTVDHYWAPASEVDVFLPPVTDLNKGEAFYSGLFQTQIP